MNKGVRLAAILCIVVSAALASAKTITYIIAFAPGGESDISARLQEPFFEKCGGEKDREVARRRGRGTAARARRGSY